MIYHDILRFDVAVDDALGVGKLHRPQDLVKVDPDIVRREIRVLQAEINVFDQFHDKRNGLGFGIVHNIEEFGQIRPVAELLKDCDFFVDFVEAHWLENFDRTWGSVRA
jgi:hypothetical protein